MTVRPKNQDSKRKYAKISLKVLLYHAETLTFGRARGQSGPWSHQNGKKTEPQTIDCQAHRAKIQIDG